jgi:hypothetical protein
MKSGSKVTFQDNAYFAIAKGGIIAPRYATTKQIMSNKSPQSIRPTGGTRGVIYTLNPVPTAVQDELKEVDDSIQDPVMRSLVKVDLYYKHRLTSNAREEFKNYQSLSRHK